MKLFRDRLLPGAQQARGLAVIIDVYRAFTCTPLLYAFGVKRSILVAAAEEALALKAANPDFVLIGEISGAPIDGFDLGNSPSQIVKLGSGMFRGKTVVQRTSSGVQGAIAALQGADEVLLGSYGLARATAQYIRAVRPDTVSLIAMGWNLEVEAPEDEWCATYLASLLGFGEYDHLTALREIVFHETTRKFLRGDVGYFPAEDPILCLQRDTVDFALRVVRENDWVVVERIPV
jgi:2-phosphosulfolactate phosphatase